MGLSRAACIPLVVVVLNGFLTTLLVDGGSLLDAGVVALELNAGVGREVEDALHGFTASGLASAQTCPLYL